MALARISRWLCGGGGDDDDSSNTLKTESKLATTNTVKVDKVQTDNRLRLERAAVDVNVNAPDAVTVRHEVDVLGPVARTLSKPVVAVKNVFSKSSDMSGPKTIPNANVFVGSSTEASSVTKRSATVGARGTSTSTSTSASSSSGGVSLVTRST